jgi:hypothetical protein
LAVVREVSAMMQVAMGLAAVLTAGPPEESGVPSSELLPEVVPGLLDHLEALEPPPPRA